MFQRNAMKELRCARTPERKKPTSESVTGRKPDEIYNLLSDVLK